MADRPDHDLADRPTELLAELLHHRATQNAIVRSYGIMPSSRPEDDDLDRAAAARLRQLDTLRNAIGDPDRLRIWAWVYRAGKVLPGWLRNLADAVDALAAVGDPEEGRDE